MMYPLRLKILDALAMVIELRRGKKAGCTGNEMERERDVLRREKGPLESENDKYFGKTRDR
jgi:hypothetical protein